MRSTQLSVNPPNLRQPGIHTRSRPKNITLTYHLQIPIISNLKFGNYVVEKGKIILASIYFSHRDTTHWNQGRLLPNGDYEHPITSFWAERFLVYPNNPLSGPVKPDSHEQPTAEGNSPPITHTDSEAKYSIEGLKGVYIPFGGGTNICPGRHYAKNEMLAVVAMMLWAFDFEIVDKESVGRTKASLRAFPTGTLSPDRENRVTVRMRRFE